MPRPDYIPRRDSDCRSWTLSFAATLQADPGRYGVLLEEAQAVAERVQAFDAALSIALTPALRTSGHVAGKDAARRAMVEQIRRAVRLIKAHLGSASNALIDLGLNIDGERRHPTGPPEGGPELSACLLRGYRLKVRVLDRAQSSTRQKPRGTLGAGLWVKIGGAAPRSTEECRFIALATRHTHTLQFDASADTLPVWLMGRWFDTQGRQSPAGEAIRARVAA